MRKPGRGGDVVALGTAQAAATDGSVKRAPREQVAAIEELVLRVLEALAKASGESGIAKAWVSDLSSVGDFGLGAGPLAKASALLQVELSQQDLLVDVARRLRH